MSRKSFWSKLDSFPPIVCRLLARTEVTGKLVRPLTATEISERSGLSVALVDFLSKQISWKEIPFKYIQPFIEGCGIYLADREDYRTHSAYIARGPSWRYLRDSKEWESVYKPLIVSYVRSQTPK